MSRAKVLSFERLRIELQKLELNKLLFFFIKLLLDL